MLGVQYLQPQYFASPTSGRSLGNRNLVNKVANSGEIFRYMAAVVRSFAGYEYVHRSITLLENFYGLGVLECPKQGQKGKLRNIFMEDSDVCESANGGTVDKRVNVLMSPLRDALVTWVTFGVGLEAIPDPRDTRAWLCLGVSTMGGVVSPP